MGYVPFFPQGDLAAIFKKHMCIFEKKVCSPVCNAILNIEREVKTVEYSCH